ncbi:uncharacterized protein I206_102669 [Kwoniella pini CBS 10737]|uniref:F-box domain-containing protein n=1 Tax=Kwoniella pini CBS 10737 TaxID=1296096 RepID=A0A1B9I607_9TREE|nr:uncharacterized protein I206_03022 [Kwoniella pini CBS 10737]OCF50960.1 hypothetical protein I206_03022 [Kwoniella pini CBS 10737]
MIKTSSSSSNRALTRSPIPTHTHDSASTSKTSSISSPSFNGEGSSDSFSPNSNGNGNFIRKHKTSLDFICSPSDLTQSTSPKPRESSSTPKTSPSYMSPKPSSPPLSTPTITESLITSTGQKGKGSTMNGKSGLECLPRELLALVAYHLLTERGEEKDDEEIYGIHPSNLLPLLFTSKSIYEAICFDNNPQLYNTLFRVTFDIKALDRRYQWMKNHLHKNSSGKGKGKKVFDLFADPRSWAIDYKIRWEQSFRMRQVAKQCRIEIPDICDKEAYVADLWNVWFLLTENDNKNIKFLHSQCDLRGFILAFYKENLLKESLVPGYPRDTGDKALAVWCCLLAGIDDLGEDTPADVDEKIFMLRPYVFACAKYDTHYAPWHYRKLPFCPPDCVEHETDASIRLKAMTYKRFGYTWKRAPPHFVLGIYLVFFRLLERQPDRVGLKAGSSSFHFSPFEAGLPSLFSGSKLVPSIEHDREWQRNIMSQDPHTSPGLPPTSFSGMLKGFWRGKFLFYDFDLYRQILAGNMRGVYTGTFAEQAAEFELHETIVKLPKEKIGGEGPLLAAGFKDEFDEDGSQQIAIKEGYGFEICDENEEVQEGWTKEILISGRARTSWGWAKIRGRIRSWDGLVILEMTYSRHVMGRWIWRGYLHTGGYMVGRWRDTFTAENLRGYEGAFGMIRAGDPLYPDHFPKRMEDSLGVNVNVPRGQGGHSQHGQGGHSQQGQSSQNQHSSSSTTAQASSSSSAVANSHSISGTGAQGSPKESRSPEQ